MHRTLSRAAFVVLAAAPIAAVGGCSVSVGETKTIASKSVSIGGATIKGDELEKQAVAEFGDKVPKGATVECPDVKGEKGATGRCTWTLADRSTLGMSVTVTSFTESSGTFRVSFENDTQVTPAP